jgi:hypothetical protein
MAVKLDIQAGLQFYLSCAVHSVTVLGVLCWMLSTEIEAVMLRLSTLVTMQSGPLSLKMFVV